MSKTINILVSVPSIFSIWGRGKANLIDFKNLTYVKKNKLKIISLKNSKHVFYEITLIETHQAPWTVASGRLQLTLI